MSRMRSLLVALAALLALAEPAFAQKLTNAQVNLYTSQPQTLSVTMGALDKAGFGGVDLSGEISGPVTLVSVTNNTTHATCTSSCDHAIDGWGQLVWRGTYGGSITASPGASYTDVVQNGAGQQLTVNVTVCATCSFVRSHYVAPNYAPAGYTLSNPDNPTSFQLRTLLDSASFPLDGVIHMRDESGTSGLTPGLDPYYWILGSNLNSNEYQVAVPGTAGALASYTYADGSGAARIIDSGSSGSTLSWTSMAAYTGTGLNCSHTYYVVGPGIPVGETGTCNPASPPGTGAGSLTLSQPLRSDFVAGEKVVVTGRILVDSEHPNSGTDEYGNPATGGAAQIGQIRVNGAADFMVPLLFQDLTLYDDTPPGGSPAVFCGYYSSNTAGGVVLTVLPYTPGVTYSNCTQASRGTIALQQGMSSWDGATISGAAGDTYVIRTGANTSPTDCNGSPCTGSGNPNPASPETYRVDSGNLVSVAQGGGSSSAPVQFTSGLWGTAGGLPGNSVNAMWQFMNSGGWGLMLNRVRFQLGPDIPNNQIERNLIDNLEGQAITVMNSFVDGGNTAFTTNPGNYTQRTGSVADACTGTQPALVCAQNYIVSDRARGLTTDFIDETISTADTDAESNFVFDTRPNIDFIQNDPGDTFTITDSTASASKTYTFVSSITGGGNVDGNVLASTNMATMLLNMACTINAAHNAYIQIAPFYPKSTDATQGWNGTAPKSYFCQDGVNLPAAETADPSVVATIDMAGAPIPDYFLPLLAKTPGDTLTTSWWASIYNQNQGSTVGDCVSICTVGQFSTGAISNSTTLPVSAITSGQVVVGAVITAVSGSPTGLTSSTRVVSYNGAGAPGGTGNYTLSNAISCAAACTFSQVFSTIPALHQGTLHPDFMQGFGLNVSTPSNPVPYAAHYNIDITGNQKSNYLGSQGFSFNGGSNLCCFTGDVGNNIVMTYLTNYFEIESQENSHVYRNLFVTDIAAPFFDPSDSGGYDFLMGQTMNAPNHAVNYGVVVEDCTVDGNNKAINNVFTSNITNGVIPSASRTNCATASYSESPSVEVGLGWGQATEAPVSAVSARYAAMFPNYPAALGAGTAGCGTTRAKVIDCMAPAKGQIFTASLDASCNLITSATLSVNTHVNGPGIPALTNNQVDSHVTSGAGTSGNPYVLGGITGAGQSCTVEPSGTTYSTGAENVDGTYSGALFPADNAGVISWNDGTVFNPAATHTPAQ